MKPDYSIHNNFKYQKNLQTKINSETLYKKILLASMTKTQSKSFIAPQSPSQKKIWLSQPKTPENITKIRRKNLVEPISCYETLKTMPMGCGLDNFKVLADLCQVHEISLTIPETVIIGYGFPSSVLLYTDEKGFLRVKKDLNTYHLKVLLDILEKYRCDNNHKYIGPLAIKREPDSNYNKIFMKKSEIVLEWKESYKVDVIIQRYILSKGTKSSKIRISMNRDFKIFKIVNKIRQDFKEDRQSKISTASLKFNINSLNQKNIFTEILEDCHSSSLYGKSYEYFDFKNPDLNNLKNQDLYASRQSIEKNFNRFNPRKSIFNPVNPVKKNVLNIAEYLKACIDNPPCESIQQLLKKLKDAKKEYYDFDINTDDKIHSSLFREKLNSLFCLSIKNSSRSDVYEIKTFKGLSQALEMMNEFKRIINGYFLSQSGQKLTKLICDFVEDSHQNIYLIKIKNYEFTQITNFSFKKSPTESFFCPGKYCDKQIKNFYNKVFRIQSYKILKKTIVAHEKKFDDPILMLDPRLYEKVRVCKNCFNVYTKKFSKSNKKTLGYGFNIKSFNEKETLKILNEINLIKANDVI